MFMTVGKIPSETVWKSADLFTAFLAGDWTNNLSVAKYHVLILTNQINSRRALTAEPARKSDKENIPFRSVLFENGLQCHSLFSFQ